MSTQEMIQKVLDSLNQAFKDDPAAINALIINRVPCNEKLVEHPDIIVDFNFPSESHTVGAMGLLNGALGAAGLPLIATQWDTKVDEIGRHKMLGFCLYTPIKK